MDKYILDGHEPVLCPDFILWGKWFGTAERILASTELGPDVRVSTVFLGIDHSWGYGPPILWETMIFGGEHDEYQDRYSTWDQAKKGHDEAVKMATAAMPRKQDE